MFIEFIKDHFSGIAKGSIVEVEKKDGKRFVDSDFAKEATPKAFKDYVSNAEARKEKVLEAKEALKAEEAKAVKKEEDAIRAKVKKSLEDRIVKQAAAQKIVNDAANKARKESEKLAKDQADQIAKDKEASRLKALEQRIQLEEEAKLN